MIRSILLFVVCSVVFLRFAPSLSASSSYVLPYPSVMPGSKLYGLQQTIDWIKEKWYFGEFGRFTFAREQADRYLVEAKTLFEYGQYRLALIAIERSDEYIRREGGVLRGVDKNGSGALVSEFHGQLSTHTEVIEAIAASVPASVMWEDEGGPVELPLGRTFEKSINLRKSLHE